MLVRSAITSTNAYLSATFFFITHTATAELYTLSLHDALPISAPRRRQLVGGPPPQQPRDPACLPRRLAGLPQRSEEHTSELQSRFDLVCRLLLEKKKRVRRRLRHRQPHESPQH